MRGRRVRGAKMALSRLSAALRQIILRVADATPLTLPLPTNGERGMFEFRHNARYLP